MTSSPGGNCSSSGESYSTIVSELKQATPFNIGTFGVLFVFCVIIALTSSLYYNWPAVERILVDDKVFQNLCTKQEIQNAIDGMFVCDKQRIEIGNLALIIFYSEFVAFAIGGFLTDVVGVGSVLTMAFGFGFAAFIILYYFYMDNFMIKVAFALWGMFGGFVFITSIHFPKMFPEAKSLADGMIILFDNLSNLTPLIIYKIMKKFDLRYYEAFGTYLLWGVFPSLLLTLSFIPSVIVSKDSTKTIRLEFQHIQSKVCDTNLWISLITYSAPVTCSIFYKKTFSTYFLKNQSLVKIFPIIMLFVFVPTLFIAALNQFMGVHITSAFLYVLYIISFVCFLYPTKYYGLLSIILFVISTSAAEQQTMTYISENHPQNESTLMGISYAVDFVLGFILQRIFTFVYNRHPMSILFIIIPIFLICIAYSLYSHIQSGSGTGGQGQTGSKFISFRPLCVIFWFVPFFLLCLVLSFNNFNMKRSDISNIRLNASKITNYQHDKRTIISIMFHSFTFYYVFDCFLVIISIFKFTCTQNFSDHRFYGLFYLLICFFIIPQTFIYILFRQGNSRYSSVLGLSIVIFLLKIGMFVFSKLIFTKMVILSYSVFLMIYGLVFFIFIYMLAYYNFQITYVERCYKTSLLHWGSMITMFMLFKSFYNILRGYELGYFILWIFNICFFVYFVIILHLYFPYEMDIIYNFDSSNLPIPIFSKFDLINNFQLSPNKFYFVGAISLSIWSLGVLMNIQFNKSIIWLFIISSLYDIIALIYRLFLADYNHSNPNNEYVIYSLSGFSVIAFILLLLLRMFVSDINYKNSSFIVFIKYLNMVAILMNSNLCWLYVQYELQKCCCTDNTKPTCCDCCCTCKPVAKNCECLTNNVGKCCCCCKTNGTGCTCDSGCCQRCRSNSHCQNCVCRCLKKFKKVTEDDHTIIFCFYECNFQKVDECFSWYYFGTIVGWLSFIIYLNISRGKILYNVLL